MSTENIDNVNTDNVNTDNVNIHNVNTDNVNIHDFNMRMEYINKFNFKTRGSIDINHGLLTYAVLNIDRKKAIEMLSKLIDNVYIVRQIEKGIFEFALINININNYNITFVTSIYYSKLNDICDNVDTNNKHINNTTLLNSLYSGTIQPFFLAFMSPEQIHPVRWAPVLNRQLQRETAKHSVPTTNMYTCTNCKENKFKVMSIQLRSADEPDSLFLTCLTCYKTVIE